MESQEGQEQANVAATDLEAGTSWTDMLDAVQEHWLGSFLLNLLGYAIIILPAALLIRRWKKSPAVQSGELEIERLLMSLIIVRESLNPPPGGESL